MRCSEVPIRTGSVQMKPWLLIALARACFYFYVVVNKQIIASLKSCLSEVGAARQCFAQSPVHEWQSRIRMKHSVDAENGQFTAKKPMTGESDSGHSSQGSYIVWFHEKEIQFCNVYANGFVHILHIHLNNMSFFPLRHFSVLTAKG